MDELKQPALEALQRRPRPLPPGVAAPVRDRLARERARLEHLAPDLVGSPDSRSGSARTGTRRSRRPSPEACAECGSTELTRSEDVLDTWFSSALWPFAILGWPEETPELEAWYPGTLNTTAREIIRLWENRMIFSGLELIGEIPFRARDHPHHGARPGRAADVEEPRHRARPARADRRARRGRDPLRAAQDVVVAGRPLLDRRDRGGPQAREQALERRAGSCSANAAGGRPSRRPDATRGALDLRAARRDTPGGRRGPRRLRLRSRASTVLYHLTFDDFCDWYAEAIKPRLYDERRGRARRPSPRSSGCSSCCIR